MNHKRGRYSAWYIESYFHPQGVWKGFWSRRHTAWPSLKMARAEALREIEKCSELKTRLRIVRVEHKETFEKL